ncbi:MAG: type II toxin-antitoxin system RelE/ParE family toxin, partial [Anaerolineales bacterium]
MLRHRRERRKLPPEVRPRVNQALLALEDEPRPHGVTKLAGYANRWRVRIGDYRVIYQIYDQAQAMVLAGKHAPRAPKAGLHF